MSKLLQYSTRDGSREYVVAIEGELTAQVIEDNARPGFTLDGAFDLVPLNPFRGCVGELRLGAEYVRAD
jgi:hypothetical protein